MKSFMDKDFLNELNNKPIIEKYIKISLYDFKERFIQEIQGIVKSGNIQVNAGSAVRRTGSLEMIASSDSNDLTNVKNLVSINRKIKIEVGLKNFTNKYKDEKIIWIPMGWYIITSANISHSIPDISISIQFRDKMCLLNGDCSGTLPAAVTFSEKESLDDSGNIILETPTIYQIVYELVNHFGGEQIGNIYIKDLPHKIRRLMRWSNSAPLYIYQLESANSTSIIPTLDEELAISKDVNYKTYPYGSLVGYIYSDFVYPGELVGNAGQTVTDILDTIVNTLGNYEYFYDIDGKFHFQEIKNYLNTTQTTIEIDNLLNEDYLIDRTKGKAEFSFTKNKELISSCDNSPKYEKIKNDYIIWGTREGVDGITSPIRYHLAIDKKPAVGNTYRVFFWDDEGIKKAKIPELYSKKADFPTEGIVGNYYYDNSTQYLYKYINKDYELVTETPELKNIITTDWRTELYFQGVISELRGIEQNRYYAELENEWPQIYDIENGEFYQEYIDDPSLLKYWLDFIDTGSKVGVLGVDMIGARSKVESSNDINCIFEPDIPDLILIENNKDEETRQNMDECETTGQNYSLVDSAIYSSLVTGYDSNSGYEKIREWLYEYLSYNESISLTTIPIYHLEPNIRITVDDIQSGINGDFLLQSFNIPLDATSLMSIEAIRVFERF